VISAGWYRFFGPEVELHRNEVEGQGEERENEKNVQQDHYNGEIKTLEEVDQQTNQQEKDHVGNIL